jgi:hypothetical protein
MKRTKPLEFRMIRIGEMYLQESMTGIGVWTFKLVSVRTASQWDMTSTRCDDLARRFNGEIVTMREVNAHAE